MPTPIDERRNAVRARTRLRPGKLLDAGGRFVADCAILDRSTGGARIRLFEPIEAGRDLQLLDESQRATVRTRIVWQCAGEVGLRLEDDARHMEGRDFLSAAGPYYAVR